MPSATHAWLPAPSSAPLPLSALTKYLHKGRCMRDACMTSARLSYKCCPPSIRSHLLVNDQPQT
eukprot:6179524-Pleurochrysis_carterae.AAC.2